MKKFLILIVLPCIVFSNTAFAYTLSKADTRIATNKVKILNERIQKGTPYSTIYKQQLNIQNNIKKNKDNKNIKSMAFKNLDKNYAILQYILENLIDSTNKTTINNQISVKKNNNCDDGWYYNEGVMNCQPNNPIKSCNISNGIGKQTWNGNGWNSCNVVSCNTGYSASNGSCLVNQPVQESTPIINQSSCSSSQHLENNICVSNSKSCSMANGVGEQTWNGSSYGSCNVVSCNTGYENKGDSASCTLAVIASQYPGCDTPDIVLGDKVWAACNVGSNIAGFGAESYGSYYQWGRNDTGFTVITENSPYDWQQSNGNSWGDTTNTNVARQGPCAIGYHIPTQTEWMRAIEYSGDKYNNNIGGILKLPFAGWRGFDNAEYYGQGGIGTYWSSSPDLKLPKSFYMNINTLGNGNITGDFRNSSFRAVGYSVRCIKN
ncbi:hypothetical protein HOO68_03950 [Candidatus Gracilibacteria bacterium]|nr:hypothetical protein [Candidatus Gracilibacteria bacterium]